MSSFAGAESYVDPTLNYTGEIVEQNLGCTGEEYLPMNCPGSNVSDPYCSSPSSAAGVSCIIINRKSINKLR